ncbi:VOC family protein [Paenibacillus arenilitoris]|uniref:VOC family protein n=1 Tax=Paenibacillus arenilitoris TaxID=2772299 RepID=A0A927H7B3_9BACL|nr:VOC family protein [Paenibacillus arenilitoris]MBD2869419.1 VOC family protein [Paenibacillus arenilitoris]
MIRNEGLHHVSIIVSDLERSKSFYERVLGLREIERPPFGFPGAWYAVGGSGQQLHIIVHDGETKRAGGIDSRDGHFAVSVSDYGDAIDWLERHGIEYRANPNSMTGFAQIFMLDPDRNIIELNAAMRPEGREA